MIAHIKINSLNPFDRKFFGQSIRRKNNSAKLLYPSNLKHNSVDDFNKYMYQKSLNNIASVSKK